MIAIDSAACNIATGVVDSWVEFFTLAIPPLSIVGALVAVFLVVCKRCRAELTWEKSALLAAFCLVGVIPGIVAGYSQQAIAGTFLTATIGIISALLSFGFAQQSLEAWRPVIPVAMILTLFGALAGFSTGGVAKDRWLVFDQSVQQSKYMNEQVRGPIEKARQDLVLARLAKANDKFITRGELAAAINPPPPPPQNKPEPCFG